MARKYELTWQSGIGGRAGRWRKKFRGRPFYFDGGRGKSDKEAYGRAMEDWKRLRHSIEEQDSKPHESEYLDVLREWRAVKDWASQNADQTALDLARSKIKELETRLAGRRPQPITTADRFEAAFAPPIIDLTPFINLKVDLSQIDKKHLGGMLGRILDSEGRIVPDNEMMEFSDGSPWRIAKELWRDRIASQLRLQDTAAGPASIEGNVTRFLAQKRSQVNCGELSAGRFASLETHLTAFRDFVSGSNPVEAITSRVMTDFRTDLLDRKARGEFGGVYAKNRLDAAKQFTRWLWREETLVDLPRVIESKNFSISAGTPEIKTLTFDEITALLAASSGQTKLCILLGLNIGMTQRDISDLQQNEVDWHARVIRRKRSKTRKFANVPEVEYSLWSETFDLLKAHRRPDCPQVLANENGGPLLSVSLKENGKLYKVDNVHTNFFRLCRRVGIEGRSFKSLRKTSATLLRGNEKYSGLESLFLGHAARSISDRHYAGIPHELLASAINWLAEQFGLAIASKRSGSTKKEGTKPVLQPAPKRANRRVAKAPATRAS